MSAPPPVGRPVLNAGQEAVGRKRQLAQPPLHEVEPWGSLGGIELRHAQHVVGEPQVRAEALDSRHCEGVVAPCNIGKEGSSMDKAQIMAGRVCLTNHNHVTCDQTRLHTPHACHM
jgi:hypothetical protein